MLSYLIFMFYFVCCLYSPPFLSPLSNYPCQVLDLMVRMLGFTDEDRRKVARAAAGHGRATAGSSGGGVLGLSSRLVGGLFGAAAGGGGEGGSGSIGSTSSVSSVLAYDHTLT